MYCFNIAAVNFDSIPLSKQNDLQTKIHNFLFLKKIIVKNLFLLKTWLSVLLPIVQAESSSKKSYIGWTLVLWLTPQRAWVTDCRQSPLMSELSLKALHVLILHVHFIWNIEKTVWYPHPPTSVPQPKNPIHDCT